MFRGWSLAWSAMDADTIDAYVQCTENVSRTVLGQALIRLAKAHTGPYRPAPALILDRCYEIFREKRSSVPQLESGGITQVKRADLLAIWDRCIDKALSNGYGEDSGRIRFWRRGRARLAQVLLQRAEITTDDLLHGLV